MKLGILADGAIRRGASAGSGRCFFHGSVRLPRQQTRERTPVALTIAHYRYRYGQPERSVRSNRHQSGWLHVRRRSSAHRAAHCWVPGYQFFIAGDNTYPTIRGRRWDQSFRRRWRELRSVPGQSPALGPRRKADHRHHRSARFGLVLWPVRFRLIQRLRTGSFWVMAALL